MCWHLNLLAEEERASSWRPGIPDRAAFREVPSLPFSFGCLFHQKPFNLKTETSLFRGGSEERLSFRRELPTKPYPCPFQSWRFRGFRIHHPTPEPPVFCRGCLLKWKKTPMKHFPKNICFQRRRSTQWSGSVQRTQAPLPRPSRLQLGHSTSHSQNHFLCKTSSLRRKNALIV